MLDELVAFFGCGRVRPKGPKSSVWTFAVDSLKRQEEFILPFFEHHPLVIKDADFRSFAAIVRMMRRRQHLTASGFEQAVRLAFAMNANGKQRIRSLDEILTGSSETARWARSEGAPFL